MSRAVTTIRSEPDQFRGGLAIASTLRQLAVHVQQPERDRLAGLGVRRDRAAGGEHGLRILGVDERGERALQHLVRRPAEEAGQGGTRESDLPLGIEREDQVGGVLQQQPEPVLPLLVRGAQGLEPARPSGRSASARTPRSS